MKAFRGLMATHTTMPLTTDFIRLPSGSSPVRRRTRGEAHMIRCKRILFDIKGNADRFIVHVRYAPLCLVFVRFVGTHARYCGRNDATVADLIASRAATAVDMLRALASTMVDFLETLHHRLALLIDQRARFLSGYRIDLG